MIFKSLLTLLTVLLSTGAGLAQKEPSFPHSMTEHAMKKQYIVQFKHDSDFQLAKTATTKDKKIQVLRNMDKIQTGVYKFKSNGAAQRWRQKNANSIKFFEKGEKINIHFEFIIRRSFPPSFFGLDIFSYVHQLHVKECIVSSLFYLSSFLTLFCFRLYCLS